MHDSPTPAAGEGIAVFAPTLLLTITVEASARDGAELHIHAGGQGFWIARMIARLGQPVSLCAPLGGDTGRVLQALAGEEGVTVRGVAVSGENGCYVHDRRSGTREVIAELGGAPLDRHEVDDLYDTALVAGLAAQLVVLTGQHPTSVLPPDVYRRLATDCRSNGRIVIADLSGEDLAEALAGGVDYLKVSEEDLVADGLCQPGGIVSLTQAMFRLRDAGAQTLIVTRAAEPAIALVENQFLEIRTPPIEPVEARGAGDSMTAAFAASLARGALLPEALRTAAAAGALNVSRHGLGTGRPEDIAALSNLVEISELEFERTRES
jgi:1-phosphofructokinase